MSTNYDDQITKLELEYQLEAQKNALTRVEIECLKAKKKIEDYEVTKESIHREIQKTKERIATLKGGGENG